MLHKCDHCDYESNRMYNIRRHVKNKHESHHANNENKVDNDVSSEDEIIEDMEQVAAEMEKYVGLNKTVEDKESNQ